MESLYSYIRNLISSFDAELLAISTDELNPLILICTRQCSCLMGFLLGSFTKQYWNIIAPNLLATMHHFLKTCWIPPLANSTIVSLIPEKENLMFSDF